MSPHDDPLLSLTSLIALVDQQIDKRARTSQSSRSMPRYYSLANGLLGLLSKSLSIFIYDGSWNFIKISTFKKHNKRSTSKKTVFSVKKLKIEDWK
ncbi:uncharacterized protein LOC105433099 isoform X2 [Pogonomyrmex barbatus]|uniref:Uncharacterized protein LOC105433099 isoform X2 n=1 Tax=Pogonomyrmex barbatus TaxID=144034 RepID=A0A6I9WVA2_9HYME|nr:uncharacterized protein LOC105433099 isoform X2 [Pogonomyrmex barbatus]